MNDNERAELVEAYYESRPITMCDGITDDGREINRRAIKWDELSPIQQTSATQRFTRDFQFAFPIIDRLLADRALTVAEPDADAVERVAKAMEHYWRSAIQTDEGWSFSGMAEAATKAASRAAIAAMPSSADDNWLDAALDSVSLVAAIPHLGRETTDDGDDYYYATIEWPSSKGGNSYRSENGTGPTRRAAIEDAVRKAKGQE